MASESESGGGTKNFIDNEYVRSVTLFACGICPICRRRTVECDREILGDPDRNFDGYLYQCDHCHESKYISLVVLGDIPSVLPDGWEMPDPAGE